VQQLRTLPWLLHVDTREDAEGMDSERPAARVNLAAMPLEYNEQKDTFQGRRYRFHALLWMDNPQEDVAQKLSIVGRLDDAAALLNGVLLPFDGCLGPLLVEDCRLVVNTKTGDKMHRMDVTVLVSQSEFAVHEDI
jgi:hypothetical protein